MLHTEVKGRILQLAKNDPNLLRKIFNDFDLNGTETLTIDEVTNLIAKLRIYVERKFILLGDNINKKWTSMIKKNNST